MIIKAVKVVFVVVFILVTLFVGKLVFDSIYDRAYEFTAERITGPDVEITDAVFSCASTNQDVAYIFLRGFGNHNPNTWAAQLDQIGDVPSMDFEYDETHHLDEISDNFLSEFNTFVTEHTPSELVIFGESAGGTIISYSLPQITFDGHIEVHTLASPLRGSDAPAAFVAQTGFGKDIATGLDPYQASGDNVDVHHHKTVTDSVLTEKCPEQYSEFCDPLKMQNNNVPGSQEYYYSDEDHTSIMTTVTMNVIACHS